MNPIHASKLRLASLGAVLPAAAAVHEFARECAEMRAPGGGTGRTNPPGPRELAPRQLAAIALLVSGRTARFTAKALGIHPCTIRRWKTNPLFQAEVLRRTATAPAVVPAQGVREPEEKNYIPTDEELNALFRSVCRT